MLQAVKIGWRRLGHLLEWLGAIYAVGFGVFGAVSLVVLVPKYQTGFNQTGQAGIFTRLEEVIGPLVVLFVVVSLAAWYQGKELREAGDLTWYDKIVALALLLAIIFILTPQLYLAVTSLIPAIRG